jgi:sigma-E factor negative regulatory protein RseC
MSQESNTVSAVVRALDGKDALVAVESGGCGRCHEEGGCGGQQLTQMFCSTPKTYRVDNALGAAIGDRVLIAIEAGNVRRTANLAYGVPIVAVIGGAALGTWVQGDLGAMLGAVVGLASAFLYVRFRSQGEAENLSSRPYIISRS